MALCASGPQHSGHARRNPVRGVLPLVSLWEAKMPKEKPSKPVPEQKGYQPRSEEHTSELQSLMRSSYAVFCLIIKNRTKTEHIHANNRLSNEQRKDVHTTQYSTL